MTRRSLAATAALLALAVLTAACDSSRGSSGAGDRLPSIDAATFFPQDRPSAGGTGGNGSPAPGSSSSSSPQPGPSVNNSPQASPSPYELPWENTLGVNASISPACVKRGGLATITIRTTPKAAVAYHAIYAGTHGGAPPPYGAGYGGNASGFADRNGRWTSTWTVRIDAPVGPARADVIASDGDQWGYDDPPFTVAGPTGNCG